MPTGTCATTWPDVQGQDSSNQLLTPTAEAHRYVNAEYLGPVYVSSNLSFHVNSWTFTVICSIYASGRPLCQGDAVYIKNYLDLLFHHWYENIMKYGLMFNDTVTLTLKNLLIFIIGITFNLIDIL